MASSSPPGARRAAAMVEFALIAPFFILLILGMIEFGRALMVQQILVNAAREGCRQATLPLATDAQVASTVSTYMKSAGVSGYSETLTPPLASNPPSGTPLKLLVSVPAASAGWSPAIFLRGKTLSAAVVMIKE